VTETVVQALKEGMAAGGEQRLFRAGKLPGLFASRAGTNAEAAKQALETGLLEVVRTETRGKTVTEWGRVTPRGVEFVHERESPVRAMEELHQALETTQEGVPRWVAEIRQKIADLGKVLTEEVQNVTHRLEVLSGRVLEALRRHDDAVPQLSPDAASAVP